MKRLKTRYFTFGFQHVHEYEDEIFDRNTVVKITSQDPRQTMVSIFGTQWSFEHREKDLDMKFFPGGIIEIDEEGRIVRNYD